jgi:hypothetical protein
LASDAITAARREAVVNTGVSIDLVAVIANFVTFGSHLDILASDAITAARQATTTGACVGFVGVAIVAGLTRV